jgi:diaminohydroxyphosphoribosylaminopyrimidine deaminase/5-amino-6-(5-phosphoribosylamino)uracil reductase
MSETAPDAAYMRQALELARRGLGRTSPNPAVGALVVKDGEVVGRGFHTWAGVKHAEVLALEEAGERARGATLYVTLEPCVHHGRTGPCTEAIVAAGIRRVVAAVEDPNPAVHGAGLRRLAEAGIEVELAENFRAEAERLNEPFFHFMRTGRPLVTLKAALTLDGRITTGACGERWITSEQARAHVQQLRHLSDAILTGIGTVLADDCLLTDRTGLERSRPLLRIVLDSQLRIPPESRLIRSARSDVLVVTTSAASLERRRRLEACGVEVLTLDGPGGRTDLPGLVDRLAERKYLSLLIEAGSRVNWSALESGVADKVFFYYAPKILGGLESLPVAGGSGRRRRRDAILLREVALHRITAEEFAVEAWVVKG